MRVIAGEAKGRGLYSVPGQSTRPITDRVKASLFNILAGHVPEARFLDLFAGTGGVGIEALSRGASEAVFVERDQRALATIRRNLEVTGLAGRARVVKRDVFQFVAGYSGQPFDIVYVAPPQYQGLWARTLHALDGSSPAHPATPQRARSAVAENAGRLASAGRGERPERGCSSDSGDAGWSTRLASPGTLVVAQIYPKEYEPLELATLVLADQRKYGSTLLCFYQVRQG
jgi:16S rRNA (guanine(966)-N(2))-methyltransferase RsmD